MTQERKRTTISCGNCGKVFSIQDSELKRRIRNSSNGYLFHSAKCFQEFQRNNKSNSHKK